MEETWDVQGLYLQQLSIEEQYSCYFWGQPEKHRRTMVTLCSLLNKPGKAKSLSPPPNLFSFLWHFVYTRYIKNIYIYSVGKSCQEIPFPSFLWAWESPNQPLGTNSTNPVCFHSAEIQKKMLAGYWSPESMPIPSSPGLARRPL